MFDRFSFVHSFLHIGVLMKIENLVTYAHSHPHKVKSNGLNLSPALGLHVHQCLYIELIASSVNSHQLGRHLFTPIFSNMHTPEVSDSSFLSTTFYFIIQCKTDGSSFRPQDTKSMLIMHFAYRKKILHTLLILI